LLFRIKQQTGDSLTYALSIATGERLFHPHHLLYNGLVRSFYLIINFLFPATDAVLAAQLFNIFWAIVSVISIYMIVKMISHSEILGILAACLLLVSFGFWMYTSQVEVYIPATGCLACLTAIIVSRKQQIQNRKKLIWFSILFGMAILFHQTNVLFCIPLVYLFVAFQGRQGFATSIQVVAGTGLSVLFIYIIVFIFSAGRWDLHWFIRFCKSYTYYANPDWGNVAHFSFTGMRKLVSSQMSNILYFHANSGFNIKLFFILPLGGAVVVNSICKIKNRSIDSPFRLFLLLWMLTYYLFFLWWLPGDREFFIVTLVPIIILIFMSSHDLLSLVATHKWIQKGIYIVFAGLIASVFVVNFKRVLPMHQSFGASYKEAKQLANHSSKEGVILAPYELHSHLKYYFPEKNALILPHHIFYNHKKMPYKYQKIAEKCRIVPLRYVQPENTIFQKNRTRIASEWCDWIAWLFNFQYNSSRRLIAYHQFHVVQNMKDQILIVEPVVQRIDGIQDFLQISQKILNVDPNLFTSVFNDWSVNLEKSDKNE